MSAMPDLRLQATPEVKSKAKPAAKAPEPSRNEPSSFANVYAKERQTQSGERPGAAGKAGNERPAEKGGDPAQASDAAAEETGVATTGNSLPEEPGQEELDPLLAMALAGQQPAAEAEAAVEETPSVGIPTLAATATAAVEGEPELAAEDLDPLARLQQPVAEEPITFKPEADAATKAARTATSTDFAAAMAAMGKGAETAEGEKGTGLELPLDDIAKEALESLKDSVQPNRPEQFVSKLNALTQALAQHSPTAARLPLVPGQPVPMQQGGWSEAVVDRVMWMSSQNLKSAEIQLDPAELGRLEVRVNLTQDQAQVTFASANPGVREALEGQMHRLREMFTQQGMNLSDANVSDQSLNRGGQGQGEESRGGSGGRGSALAVEDVTPVTHQEIRQSIGRGLVDYYA